MPRRAREKSESGTYHVMLRGIDRSTIFHDEEDCCKFLCLLRECMDPDPDPAMPSGNKAFVLYSYALMGNHLHLLIHEQEESLSLIIKRLGIRYAAYFNYKYRRTGHVFQDRYKSEPVDTEPYLLATYRYIAMNPVHAGMTSEPGLYKWCSFRRSGLLNGYDDLITPVPADYSEKQLWDFVFSRQPEIHPFRERLSDRAAEAALLQVTGLQSTIQFRDLPRLDRKKYLFILQEEGLSLYQIARLTGIPRNNIARWMELTQEFG